MKSQLLPILLLVLPVSLYSQEANPCRFQLLSAKAFGAEGVVRDIVFRIDTTTGETWERIEATVSNQLAIVWLKIPELNQPNRVALSEAKTALVWAAANPAGGSNDGKQFNAEQVSSILAGASKEIRRIESLIPEPQRTLK